MKIIFALWSTFRTGGTNAIFNVADRLALRGHKVQVISLSNKNFSWFPFKSSLSLYCPESDIIKHPILFGGRLSELKAFGLPMEKLNLRIDRQKTLTRALNEHSADADVVVATFFETAPSVYRMNQENIAKFYYIQHFESVFFNSQYSRHRVHETYFLPLEWIVNSTWANNRLSELTGKTGPVVLPGTDHAVFYPRKVERDEKHKTIVALGKSSEVKGVKYLFEALVTVAKRINNVKLVLYGNEPELKDASPIDTEYVLSPTNDILAELYSKADVVVTPSMYESAPLPPLEAMACGSPVVTTRFGTEDYCIDRVNSLVVPPKDPVALAEAIYKVLTDDSLSEALIEKGIETSKKRTWEDTASNFEKILMDSLR